MTPPACIATRFWSGRGCEGITRGGLAAARHAGDPQPRGAQSPPRARDVCERGPRPRAEGVLAAGPTDRRPRGRRFNADVSPARGPRAARRPSPDAQAGNLGGASAPSTA